LHGNFLLGQEQRYAGPAKSTTVRYGAAALPRHSPHSTPGSAAPVSGHERPDASDWAARCDGPSGARASTRARSHRPATVETLTPDTDIRRLPAVPACPRAAAAAHGDIERMSLWAGRGYRLAAELPADEIVDRLCG